MHGEARPSGARSSHHWRQPAIVHRRVTLHSPSSMYLGPDALMPVASAIAAVLGFILMFWRRLVGAVRLLAQRLSLRIRGR